MLGHWRANLWLLVLTVFICSVLYPLVLLGIGQVAFHDKAQGSLVPGEDGKPIGSRLLAQNFTADDYFQPRPSAASYNAAASGATNWGASNYLLRDRVARQLGTIVRYGPGAEANGKKPGDLVGPDLEKWFQQDRYENKPGVVAQWATLHSGLAESWLKAADEALKEQHKDGDQVRAPGESFLRQWAADFPESHQAYLAAAPKPGELAGPFFEQFSAKHPGEWPTLEDVPAADGAKRKRLVGVKESPEIRAVFFDMWRHEHSSVPLLEVPADMVTASGSGLDPHITLANARYQLKWRVADARAAKLIHAEASANHQGFEALPEGQRQDLEMQARQRLEAKVGKRLEDRLQEVLGELLTQNSSAPLLGMAGVPLVNVLEVNVATDRRVKEFVTTGK